jgi:hypothetical protein
MIIFYRSEMTSKRLNTLSLTEKSEIPFKSWVAPPKPTFSFLQPKETISSPQSGNKIEKTSEIPIAHSKSVENPPRSTSPQMDLDITPPPSQSEDPAPKQISLPSTPPKTPEKSSFEKSPDFKTPKTVKRFETKSTGSLKPLELKMKDNSPL